MDENERKEFFKDKMYTYGSHLGPLGMALAVTEGPVLELGMGLVSTPALHGACFPSRYLLSVDEDFSWVSMFRHYESVVGPGEEKPFHFMRHSLDLNKLLEVVGKKWSVVLIDCERPEFSKEDGNDFDERIRLIKVLKDEVGILVIHDTGSACFHEDRSLWDFKHIWTFKPEGLPWTTLVSNKIDFLFLAGLRKKE